ncbi:MAG: ParA family protein [Sphaerochaetaceae bacterium]|jgi:chromosome partitioning protein|nr:ParA family protein [Sphaerochaetaceae bacterium]MDX9809539.1 ParA family protein [Sphaerochaetaceae bacterium]NLV84622.1 ParA family protein [Spirochaetales bacterium]
MAAKRIIFANQKGGVGKTTSVVNLGAYLAQMGKKVLLLDLDSQGNMTSAVSGDSRKPGAYEVIIGKCTAREAYQTTPVKNLYAIGGNINLAGLNVELVNELAREFFLKNALDSVDNEWDYIIADCPPSLGLVTINAMCWAQHVIIPMQCEYFAMEGLNLLMRTIGNVKKQLNPHLEVLGIVFTMYTTRTRLANDVVDDVSTYFSEQVFNTRIPRNVRLSEAPSHGLPINVYDASSAGAKSYESLAEEVLKRV